MPGRQQMDIFNVESYSSRGLYHEAGLGGWPAMFQFSLCQPWVLGTMKVVWLLVV